MYYLWPVLKALEDKLFQKHIEIIINFYITVKYVGVFVKTRKLTFFHRKKPKIIFFLLLSMIIMEGIFNMNYFF